MRSFLLPTVMVGLRYTAEDRQAFRDFLSTFKHGIEGKGILQNASMLEKDEFAGCLFDQVWARYGTAQRLMKVAIRIALRRGGTALLLSDFSIAVVIKPPRVPPPLLSKSTA
jgi:hypothetical protein